MKGQHAGAEILLSYPSGSSEDPATQRKLDLSKVKIHEDYAKLAETRKFQRQYAHSYSIRLWSFLPQLKEKVKEMWASKNAEWKEISELCESKPKADVNIPGAAHDNRRKRAEGEGHGQQIAFREDITVAIIGTIFKQQPLKPSILQELGEEINVDIIEPKEKYISDKDVLLFEDIKSRVKLSLPKDCEVRVDGCVNGIVCALQGRPTVDGLFEVLDVIWPTPADPDWPTSDSNDRSEMIFVSGLNFGKDKSSEFDLNLLFDYLEMASGCQNEHESQLSRKNRVFFLGNLFCKGIEGNIESFTSLANKLDEKLCRLAMSMEVFIIPDLQDPVPPMLPQGCIHKSILPKSWKRPSFHSLTNPSKLTIDLSTNKSSPQQIEMILTGGCNVKDALKNTDITCPLEMGKKLLQWGHLCPTAPDTLPVFPGADDDPFIIKERLPHVFAFGNQSVFGSTDWRNTKIISLPEFSETCQVAIFDKDFNVIPLRINVP